MRRQPRPGGAAPACLLPRLLYRANRWRWRLTRPLTVGVRVLMVRDGGVLLVRHTYQDHWYLPGGGVMRGETLEQAARREAREETGASLDDLSLFGVYTSFQESKSDHVAVFLCRGFSATGASDGEIAAVALFPLDALPADASPGTRRRIGEYLAGRSGCFGPW